MSHAVARLTRAATTDATYPKPMLARDWHRGVKYALEWGRIPPKPPLNAAIWNQKNWHFPVYSKIWPLAKKFILWHILIISERCTTVDGPNIPWKYQDVRSKQLEGDREPTDGHTSHRNFTLPLTCTYSHLSFLCSNLLYFLNILYPSLASLGLDNFLS